MSLFESIKSLIHVCQFSGLAPFSFNQTSAKWEPNVSLKVLSIFIIICLGIILLCAIVFNDSIIDYNKSKIRITLFVALFLLNHTHGCMHTMFVLLELFKKRKQQTDLLNLFENLDFLFNNHLNIHIDYKKLKITCHRILIVWIYEIVTLTIANLTYYIQTKEKERLPLMAMFVPSHILNRLSFAYNVLLVTLVHGNLILMNKYIKSVTKANGYYICETFSNLNHFKHRKKGYLKTNKIDVNPEMILLLKKLYCDIWKASKIIENLTYWSLDVRTISLFSSPTVIRLFIFTFTNAFPCDLHSTVIVFVNHFWQHAFDCIQLQTSSGKCE